MPHPKEKRICLHPRIVERTGTVDQPLDLPHGDDVVDPKCRVCKLELGQQLSGRVPALPVQLERLAI